MIRIICLGAIALLTSCTAPLPEGEVDTYCPKCYREIQNGGAFQPSGQKTPSGSTTAAGASR
jgi:hypothetical protein